MTLRRLAGGIVCAVAATMLGSCVHDNRTVLTVYSPHGVDLLKYYETEFEKAYPGIDVQWVDMGSQEVLDRIRGEAVNPQADVWFGAPSESFERAAKENLLQPYRPTWAADVPAEAHDAHDLWYGTYLTPEVIAYNGDAIPRDSAPQDWDDVLDPKWRGKVIIRDPIASGTMRAIFGAIIAKSVTETGSPQRGYDWLRRLDANTKEYVLNPTILYQKLKSREGLITLWDMPDVATMRDRVGIPIDYVIPRSGTPLLVDAIAIVRGTKHPREAKLYYEFVTSQHAQLEAARQFLRIPARTDIPTDSLPAWIQTAMKQIKPMPVDGALLAQHLNEWMRYWDAHIRKRG
ncbi:MAG TPA: extracellular solute-binding protein [Gemmatimonadaceae bacterium]|nr:extracellular solute-binding protein [Gemmatimonadaceae bacterium]